MKDVFISYSRKDMDIADIICAAFDKANISYFIDRQDIGIGHPFAEIAKAIKECTLFLYLGSRNAYVSKYAPKEINYAVLHKPQNNILPYLIDDTPMPDELEFLLCDYNWRTRREHPIEPVLINDLLDLLGRESGNKQTSSKSSQENERYVVCLVDGGHSKLQVVKTIKETFSLGLKEAKDIVDSASCDLPFELSLREVEDVTNRLKEAGAKVTVSALHDQQIVPDKFVIRLLNTGPNKLQIVKTLKENLNIGIKEAKDRADAAPCDIPQEFSLSTAASITQLLRYYGAVCAIKSLRVSKANEGKYYIELLDDAKQYVSGLEVISNRISFSRDSLIDYQMYTPCILPILLDANNAVSLERAAKQNGAAMRLIQRTPKNTEIKFKLLAPGVNKLQVAQYLRENLKIDLAKAKEYVDKAPIIVGSAKDFETTKWFADGLRELGAMVSLQF